MGNYKLHHTIHYLKDKILSTLTRMCRRHGKKQSGGERSMLYMETKMFYSELILSNHPVDPFVMHAEFLDLK